MKTLRTPDECFENLPDFPFRPHYTEIDNGDGGSLRIHHVDEGPRDGPVVLCMHGQPTWSYLYRKMIPLLVANGLRVIAPDLVGFGRSDKPASREDYSYNRQVNWMSSWLTSNELDALTLVGQDWGGLIGLRLAAAHPDRFDKIVASNTGLPMPQNLPEDQLQKIYQFLDPSTPTPTMLEMSAAISSTDSDTRAEKFAYWQKWTWETEDVPVAMVVASSVANGGGTILSEPEIAAYEAPFPDASYKMGPRAMPRQVPLLPDAPCVKEQAAAWDVFRNWKKPFLCAFTDNDPVTGGGDAIFRQQVPGTKDQNHETIKGGGHFLQEGRAPELSQIVSEFVLNT